MKAKYRNSSAWIDGPVDISRTIKEMGEGPYRGGGPFLDKRPPASLLAAVTLCVSQKDRGGGKKKTDTRFRGKKNREKKLSFEKFSREK